jgi:hypothetical protein
VMVIASPLKKVLLEALYRPLVVNPIASDFVQAVSYWKSVPAYNQCVKNKYCLPVIGSFAPNRIVVFSVVIPLA